jgi:hypothetical protein
MSCWRGFLLWCQTAYRFALAGASFFCVFTYMVAYILTETGHYTFSQPLHWQSVATIVLSTVVNGGFTYVLFAFPPRIVGQIVIVLLLVSLVTAGGSIALAATQWAECAPNDANVTQSPSPSPPLPPLLPSPAPSPSPIVALGPTGRKFAPLQIHKLRTFQVQSVLDYSHPSCLLASLQCVIMVLYCLVAMLQLFSIWSLKAKRSGTYNRVHEAAHEAPEGAATAKGKEPAHPRELTVPGSSAPQPSASTSKFSYR